MEKERKQAAEILDLVEQYLVSKGVIIEHDDDDDDDGDDDKAILYGEDYYSLEDSIVNILKGRA